MYYITGLIGAQSQPQDPPAVPKAVDPFKPVEQPTSWFQTAINLVRRKPNQTISQAVLDSPDFEIKLTKLEEMVANCRTLPERIDRGKWRLTQCELEYQNSLAKIFKEAGQTEFRGTIDQQRQTIASLRSDLRARALVAKKEYEIESKEAFYYLTRQLETLQAQYNDGNNREALAPIIEELKEWIEMRDLSTHPFRVRENLLYGLQASVFKMLTDRERALDLTEKFTESPPQFFGGRFNPRFWIYSSRQRKLENTLGNLLISLKPADPTTEKTASAARHVLSREALDVIYLRISEERIVNGEVKCVPRMADYELDEMKEALKENQRLTAYGQDAMNQALAFTTNWTTIRRVTLKESAGGNLYFAATVTTPMYGKDEEGVPARLRDAEGYRDRPCNFHKVEHWILGHKKQTRGVHFRSGQFATVSAARYALLEMLKEGDAGVHINGLLTPSTLQAMIAPFMGRASDRTLMIEQRKNVEGALREIVEQAKSGDMRGIPGEWENVDKLEKLLDEVVISNFGVNEGATGGVGIWKFRLRLGHQDALKHLNADAVERFNRSLDITNARAMRHLPAITALSREMETAFAGNRFAYDTDNQFTMPANWGALDMLTGSIANFHCMAGKDRTQWTVSYTHSLYDEKMLEELDYLRDCRRVLAQEFPALTLSDKQWVDVLNPAYSLDEMRSLMIHVRQPHNFAEHCKQLDQQKLADARKALRMESHDPGLLKPKRSWFSFLPGVWGLSTSKPVALERENSLPEIHTPPSSPKERQRRAENRRRDQASHGNIPERNTGAPGMKGKGTKALGQHAAGFDDDYILSLLKTGQAKELRKALGNTGNPATIPLEPVAGPQAKAFLRTCRKYRHAQLKAIVPVG